MANGYLVPSSELGLPRSYTLEDSPAYYAQMHSSAMVPPPPEVRPQPQSLDFRDFQAPDSHMPPAIAEIHSPARYDLMGPFPSENFTPERYALIESPAPRKLKQAPREVSSPSDVMAERSTLSWVNTLLGWIWPKANKALIQWVHEDLTPRLQESLPALFSNLHFSTFSLGRNTPDFGPVEVIQHSDSHVQIDLPIRYISDVDILIDAGTGGLTFGINQLKFTGRLCIVLKPLVSKWPLIGAMQWFFCDKPQVTLRFTGLGAVAQQFPGMDTKVQNTVDEWICSRFVLPITRVRHFTRNEDIVNLMDASTIQPLGVLRARVRRAWNLAGVNWSALSVDRFTSDPYCIMKLGDVSHRSSTVTNTTNPVWPSDESNGYFVVYHKDQSLKIDAVGDGSGRILGNSVSFLGRASATVDTILSTWRQQFALGNASGVTRCGRIPLDTASVSKEMLHVNDPIMQGISSELEVEVEWFSFVDRQSLPVESKHPLALLCVELHKGMGFPLEALGGKNGLRWRSYLQSESQEEEQQRLSRRGQLCDVDQIEFPDVPIHPQLHSVIDKLAERKFTHAEIAHVVGVESPEVIDLYLKHKAEYIQKHQERAREQQSEDHRVSLQWYETVTHFLHRLEPTSLTLELLDGEDNVVGSIGPLSLRQLFSNSPVCSPKATHALYLPRSAAGGGLASWFTGAPKMPVGVDRFGTAELQLSARLHYLKPGHSLPKRARGVH